MSSEILDNSSDNEAGEKSSGEYERILAEIDSVLAKPDEQKPEAIDVFIGGRVNELTASSQPRNISIAEFYQGFIHPESNIRRSFIVDPFRIDDTDIYSELIQNIGELKNMPGWDQKITRELMPTAVLYTIAKYFGNAVGTSGTENRNQQFYMDSTTSESQGISIKELKGRGIGVCAEKAGVCQNLLSFAGLDSTLVLSDKCQLAGEKENLYAYNIIHTERGYFIFDPTNPEQHTQQDTRALVNYSPVFYPITIEQYQNLKSGGTVEISHTDYVVTDSGTKQPEVSKRIYGGPNQKIFQRKEGRNPLK